MFIRASLYFIYILMQGFAAKTQNHATSSISWFIISCLGVSNIILRLEPLVFIIPSPPTAPVSASTWSGPRNRFGLTYASP